MEKVTLLNRFEKYAASPSQGKRVYNAIARYYERKFGHKESSEWEKDLVNEQICDLFKIPDMGRKNAAIVLNVAADLMGKK